MARAVGPALLVSLAAHAALLFGLLGSARAPAAVESAPRARSFADSVRTRFASAERSAGIQKRRAVIVEDARASLARGELSLGAFLLAANRIDAEEAGIELDADLAERRYAKLVSSLRAQLAEKNDFTAAIPNTFADFRYYGRPGGLMASALTDGGGSCEQVSQLVAAAVYDAGRPTEIALRYYGGVMEDGASHLAPIALTESGERDLMTGQAAEPGGALVKAEELIEVYAAAHGLAPRKAPSSDRSTRSSGDSADDAGVASRREEERRPTLIAGFPPNADRFPGTLPLYAARAFRDPSSDMGIVGDSESTELASKNCAYFLRIAMLSPPSLGVLTGESEMIAVEPRRVPPPLRLEREAVLLRAAETMASRPSTDPIDKLMSWACLAVLGDAAAVDFALAGEHALAAEAVRAGKRGHEEGKRALEAISWSGDEGERAAERLASDYGGRSWILLGLEGGDRVAMELVAKSGRRTWGRISALGALIVWQATRERAIELVASLQQDDQVAVMHEVFHAHAHMPPWASAFELEAPPGATPDALRFLNVYRVFRGLAWRLWEGHRPIAETLDALTSEARSAGLDQVSEAALLQYFVHNALGLYSQRPRGKDIVPLLSAAVRNNPHASLDALRRRLDYLEAQGELNARTVADAMRLP